VGERHGRRGPLDEAPVEAALGEVEGAVTVGPAVLQIMELFKGMGG